MSVHVFGIRHHGPGSARSLRRALEALEPDAILIEGPPEGDAVAPLVLHPAMRPPVALIVYLPDMPQRAVFYPFAVFSPEWQALSYGLGRGATVRFIDLPQSVRLAGEEEAGEPEETLEDEVRRDPLSYLAQAAGFTDGERWWEQQIEIRRDSQGLFAAILEAMTALRQEMPGTKDQLEARREAHMRQQIRIAQREGFERIAVVCGAWHAPVLAEMPAKREDETLLKGLKRAKVIATWVPWTYSRLSWSSGYGAGIESPGWYHHLWTAEGDVTIRWMTQVAKLLRDEDLDASSAHIIEAVRLAEALAALRDRPVPALQELNEAARTVFCFGDELPMRLVHDRLIVGEVMGQVPSETPAVPLQRDLEAEQRRLRLPPEPTASELKLDLRRPADLERSHLLHRLRLLDIPWGDPSRGGGRGTFWEVWRLQWKPDFVVRLIEAGGWGNTVRDAATAYVTGTAARATDLPALTRLLNQALLAELPEAAASLMTHLEARAALSTDIPHMMDALPPLANILRYGNVRQTDATMVRHIVDGLVARVCVGLSNACASLDDDAASAMFDRVQRVHGALSLLQEESYQLEWHGALRQLGDRPGVHGLVAGRACRLLLDAGRLDAGEAARALSAALSKAVEPALSAAWLEGFLKGSGQLLLHDDTLWQVLDDWIAALRPDLFLEVLPLVRRTFATFPAPERRRLGERARQEGSSPTTRPAEHAFDAARGERVLPLVARLLGFDLPARPRDEGPLPPASSNGGAPPCTTTNGSAAGGSSSAAERPTAPTTR